MSEECKECGNTDFPDGFMCLHCNPKGPISLLSKLLVKAKDLADCDRPIQDRAWESEDAISISALEKIVKELGE